jgi:membrane-associated phospholipid phosphatase
VTNAWWQLTTFGDSTSLLPLAVLLAIWLCARRESRHSEWLWIVALLADGGLVVASKVLYMAWGLHPPGLDFIGLSGHSAMAFVFWPVLGALAAAQWSVPRWLGIALGVALAAGVAASRLALRVHTPSEVLLGSLWGAVVAASYLWLTWDTTTARRRYGRLLLLALVPPLLLTRPLSFPSNQILAYTAEQLTGHAAIYTRPALQRDPAARAH